MISEIWQSLNPAQAQLLSGIFTLLSALLIAFVGPWLIGRQFSNLKEAAEEATNSAKSFSGSMGNIVDSLDKSHTDGQEAIKVFSSKMNAISDSFTDSHSDAQEAIEALQAVVTRLELEYIDQSDEEKITTSTAGQDNHTNKEQRNKIRDDWRKIRNEIEEIAKSHRIHGRTRNRLAAMDRRSYKRKLEEMAKLSLAIDFSPYFQALEIWNRYKGYYKGHVVQEDIERINYLAGQISGDAESLKSVLQAVEDECHSSPVINTSSTEQ